MEVYYVILIYFFFYKVYSCLKIVNECVNIYYDVYIIKYCFVKRLKYINLNIIKEINFLIKLVIIE